LRALNDDDEAEFQQVMYGSIGPVQMEVTNQNH